MKVTIGNLCDQLITTNVKMYFLENIKRSSCSTDADIADATRKTNELNVQRNTLIQEIDLALNKIAKGKKQKVFKANKMYGGK